MAGAEYRGEKWEGYVSGVRSSETKIPPSVIPLGWAHKGVGAGCAATDTAGLPQSVLLHWLSAFVK